MGGKALALRRSSLNHHMCSVTTTAEPRLAHVETDVSSSRRSYHFMDSVSEASQQVTVPADVSALADKFNVDEMELLGALRSLHKLPPPSSRVASIAMSSSARKWQ